MTPKLFVTIAAVTGLLATTPALAETCPRDPTPTNSAFGTPRPCPQAKLAVPSKDKDRATKTVKTTTPEGKTIYRTGDTEVSVSGYVQFDVASKPLRKN